MGAWQAASTHHTVKKKNIEEKRASYLFTLIAMLMMLYIFHIKVRRYIWMLWMAPHGILLIICFHEFLLTR